MTESERVTRMGVGLALPGALVALASLPPLLLAPRLPDPLATHWAGASGRPDAALPLALYAALNLAFAGVPAALAAYLARRREAAPGEIAPGVGIATFLAAVPAGLTCAVVGANLDVTSWREAALGPLPVLAALAGALALAWLAARAARRLETRVPAAPVAPSAGLRAGERAVWIGRARGRWALPLAGLLIASGVALALLAHVWIGAFGVLLSAAALPFTSLRVRADRHGVELRYGAFGWPRSRIALSEIRRAGALELAPLQWGGWGYRGSRRLFRKAAVVLRAGPALRLDLVDDTQLVVTMDDAESGAGLLNDLLARGPTAPGRG